MIDFQTKNFGSLFIKVKEIRTNFCTEPFNFKNVIDSNIIPILIQICKSAESQEYSDLLLEASWIILNGLSGDSETVRYFIEEGVIESLKILINSENLLLREQVKKA